MKRPLLKGEGKKGEKTNQNPALLEAEEARAAVSDSSHPKHMIRRGGIAV